LYIGTTSVTITINDLVISGGYSPSNGGGIYVTGTSGELFMNQVTFKNNNAAVDGGGLYIYYKKVLMKSCVVTANTAGNGAGFYNYDATLTMDNSQITSNDAVSNGDGLYVYFGTANFEGCVFSGNQGIDIYNPSCDGTVGVYSSCGLNSYNPGSGTLAYSCASYKADMSGTCTKCSGSTPYSCCGALTCVATQPTCTATQTGLCPAPTFAPTKQPSAGPTPSPPTPVPPPSPGGGGGPAPAPKSGGAGAAVGITFGLLGALALAFAAYWFWRKKQGNPIEIPEMPKFDALPDFSDCAPSGYERFNCMEGAGGSTAAPLKTDEYRVLPSGPTPTAPARAARPGARPGARGAAPASAAAKAAAAPVVAAEAAPTSPTPAAAAARPASGARPARPVRK
jgi:hypothetical protein